MRFFVLAALAVGSAIPASAGSILCPSCIPTLDVYVGGSYLATVAGLTNNAGNTFSINAILGNPGQFLITVTATTDPDPIIEYDVSVSNFGSEAQSFSLSFFSQTVGGPFSNTTTQITTSVTDLGTDGSSVVPTAAGLPGQAFDPPGLITTFLGGNQTGTTGGTCTGLAGVTQNCPTEIVNTSHTLLNGQLISQLNFTLGATDNVNITAESGVSPVPEPAMAWTICAGLLVFGLRARLHGSKKDLSAR
ncbi:MAG: hypothetical protein ACKV22_35330 [Bryobacteraceae bacterium]